MTKQLYINDQKITAKEFAWDTCHKIYLINTAKDRTDLLELEYDLFPIEELEDSYKESCALRFISNGDLTIPNVVSQFEEAVFNYKEKEN